MRKLRLFLLFSISFALGYIVTGIIRPMPVKGFFFQQPYSVPTAFNIPFYTAYARVDTAFFNVPNTIVTTSATTLTPAQSGSIVQLNAAAGYTVTLPTPAAGLYYDVISQITQTSGTMKITGGSASIFMQGGITMTGGTAINVACNGTTHTDIAMNATTTGGVRGTQLRFTGLTATLWNVTGQVVGSGTEATPCDTTP